MNGDKMEQGQQEGDDANEGEDQRHLSSYWQARFVQLEAGAARVKQLEEELEISKRSNRELLEKSCFEPKRVLVLCQQIMGCPLMRRKTQVQKRTIPLLTIMTQLVSLQHGAHVQMKTLLPKTPIEP